MQNFPRPIRRLLRYAILCTVTLTIALNIPATYLTSEVERWSVLAIALCISLAITAGIFKVTGLKRN